MADMRRDKRLWRFSKLRQAKYVCAGEKVGHRSGGAVPLRAA
jgi:hypothetical protein